MSYATIRREYQVTCRDCRVSSDQPLRFLEAVQKIENGVVVLVEKYACVACFPETPHADKKKDEMWVGFNGERMTGIYLDYPPTEEVRQFLKSQDVELIYYVRGPVQQG